MIPDLIFRVEEDGETRDVVVSVSTFDDLPLSLVAEMILLDDEMRVAMLLAYRLNVPLEAAERLVDELNTGLGVVVA